MTTFGYHASHEQFKPSMLLHSVVAAERAGFGAAMCSDHFAPWSMRQGESGYAWSWLGSALQATQLSFGTVTTPVGRYHPAIVAQAAATLAEMYLGRFWLALGSGLAANEYFTGHPWPNKFERQARVEEAATVMRRLWLGETVTHRGAFVADEAVLYTRPEEPPLLIGAAISPETAAWVARWADGMITIAQPEEKMRETIEAFRDAGGEGKPMFLQAQHSYARADEDAVAAAHDQWRVNIFDSSVLTDLRTPSAFDAAGQYVSKEDLEGHILMSSDLSKHADWLKAFADMGFDNVYIHNVGRNQQEFIEAFGREVLPAVSDQAAVTRSSAGSN